MKLKTIQIIFHKELDAIYGLNEVNSLFYLLIETYFNITRLQLALDSDSEITEEEQNPIFDALHKLKNQEPIQYILGETEFFSLSFKVNEHTLIPRPETEELVQWVIDEVSSFKSKKPLTILDIGTGSGCIAISLAKHLTRATVYALDVSAEALNLAKQNAALNDVNIKCLKNNIIETHSSVLLKDVQFDVIVSNPPYVRNL
ncbi:UNVERIFIED_CONTAM: hypothetical protein GTU68_016722, partial [Idotea baltica]|nr:hypothetical protein [Idotea baltica]